MPGSAVGEGEGGSVLVRGEVEVGCGLVEVKFRCCHGLGLRWSYVGAKGTGCPYAGWRLDSLFVLPLLVYGMGWGDYAMGVRGGCGLDCGSCGRSQGVKGLTWNVLGGGM